MALPKHIETMVGFVKEHQDKCAAAKTIEEKVEEAGHVKNSLYEIRREVDKRGVLQPRNRRTPYKQMLDDLDKHMHFFKRLAESPSSISYFEGVPCKPLTEKLRALWYEP